MKRFRKVLTTYDLDPVKGGELVPKVYHGAYVTLYGLSEFMVNLMYRHLRSKRIVEDTEFFTKKLSFWDKIELIARSQKGRGYLYHYSKPNSNQHFAYQTAIQVPDYFIFFRGLQYRVPSDPTDDYHDEANIYSNWLYRPLDEADKLDRLGRILGGSHKKPRKAKPLVVNVLSTLIRAAGLSLGPSLGPGGPSAGPGGPPAEIDEAEELSEADRPLGYSFSLGPGGPSAGPGAGPGAAMPVLKLEPASPIPAGGSAIKAEAKTPTGGSATKAEAKTPAGGSATKAEAKATPVGGSAAKTGAKTPAGGSATKTGAKTPAGGSATKAEAKTPAGSSAAKTGAKTPAGGSATKAEAKTPAGSSATKAEAKTPAGSSATKAEAKTPAGSSAAKAEAPKKEGPPSGPPGPREGPGVPVITTIPEFRQTIDGLHQQTPEQLADLAKTLGLKETRSGDDPNELYKKIINQYIAHLNKDFRKTHKDVINWVRDKATKTRYVPPTITPLRPKGKK